jgi:cobalt-zinc-cadmium efflux system outer membrane protein
MTRALVVGVWVLASGLASAQPAGAPYTLADLEQRADASHPALAAAAAAVARTRGDAEQAGAWMNPTIGYTAEEVRPGGVIRGGEHGFFVEQVIPLGRKLHLQRSALVAQGQVADADLAAARARVRARVQSAFAGVLAADERLGARTRLAALLDEGVRVAQQLYNVGIADRPDLLEAEADAARATLGVTRARLAREAAWAELAASVGDPSLPARPLAGSLQALPVLADRDRLHREIVSAHPELAAARARVDRADAELGRAKRETSPDLIVRGGLLYNRELFERGASGEARAVGWEGSAEVGISVPLWNRNKGGLAAAAAESDVARASVRVVEQALEARFTRAWTSREDALASVEAYKQAILPRAEEAYRLYLERYKEMAAAYPQVLVARRGLLDATTDYIDALEQAWRQTVQLQSLLDLP